jgi:predicted dehydrogenase
MRAPLRVGMIGVGVISKQYFESLERLPSLKLVAAADINGRGPLRSRLSTASMPARSTSCSPRTTWTP